MEDAKRNAENNGLTNCTFVAGKAEDELPGLIETIESNTDGETKSTKTVAIVDPPRAGLRKRSAF